MLPEAYTPEQIPDLGELNDLETFIGSKKNKIWLGTAVDHFRQGLWAWVLEEHSAVTFQPLRAIVSNWHCGVAELMYDIAIESKVDEKQ